MPLTPLDADRLREALSLAQQSIGLSDPNPRVGCVIAAPDGRVIGRGATQAAGQAHAEVMALRAAHEAGHALRGATVWVSLEPCAHHGRTPPCCDALIDAGVARVVVATGDPNPRVAGAGLARLRAAGIEVAIADGDVAAAARDLNIGFFSRIERGRPFVRLKSAASLDGRTALPDGRSQWITGEAARADGHVWRLRAGAILTGIGTALADDPRLTVRTPAATRQPLRVVLDSTLRLPPTARMLSEPGATLVVHTATDSAREAALRAAGAELLRLPADRPIDLDAVLAELARRDVNELHVEAGAVLGGALLRAGLVDELLIYLAPIVLGQGRGMFDIGPLPSLADAPALDLVEVTPIGVDLRLRARPRPA